MPSKHDPADLLADIVENAERIHHYLGRIDRIGFEKNNMMRDAVERCLERICGAAHRLGPDAIELMPDQAWSQVRGMGNWLRHAYDKISLDILWSAVRHEVPALASDARKALARIETRPPTTSA